MNTAKKIRSMVLTVILCFSMIVPSVGAHASSTSPTDTDRNYAKAQLDLYYSNLLTEYSVDDATKAKLLLIRDRYIGYVNSASTPEYMNNYVGNISLSLGTDVYRKSAEIGYFIGEPFWNKGIATKAVNLITEWGFKQLDIVRIHTGVFEYNISSQHVLEKCGFVKEAIFKKSIYKNGEIHDEIRFAKIKEK